jgi:hypothetical protein
VLIMVVEHGSRGGHDVAYREQYPRRTTDDDDEHCADVDDSAAKFMSARILDQRESSAVSPSIFC